MEGRGGKQPLEASPGDFEGHRGSQVRLRLRMRRWEQADGNSRARRQLQNHLRPPREPCPAHRSQLFWFRRLYVLFSRYMRINPLNFLSQNGLSDPRNQGKDSQGAQGLSGAGLSPLESRTSQRPARVPRPSPPNCPALINGAVQTQQAARFRSVFLWATKPQPPNTNQAKDNDSYLASFRVLVWNSSHNGTVSVNS